LSLFKSTHLLLLAAALAACTDPVDKVAKKRIFSPEDPPQVLSAASEKLPPERIAEDPSVAKRVLEMGAAEATERLGAHRYAADVSFEWSAKTRTVRASEHRTLAAGAGGVGGDFDAVVDISTPAQGWAGQGLEVLRVHGDVYAKDKYGKFRYRKRDRGMADRAREDVHGALRDFASLFQDRLKLVPEGTVTYEGRTAWKYAASLAPTAPPAGATKMPPLVQARSGKDPSTDRHLRFFDKRVPKAILGEVFVDADTSVVLKAHLDGRMTAPGEDGSEASLHMTLDGRVTAIGKDPQLKTPKDFLPDVDKPEGIAQALDRFGIPRLGKHADGGVETEQPDEETP
jgi:hypothetical protein